MSITPKTRTTALVIYRAAMLLMMVFVVFKTAEVSDAVWDAIHSARDAESSASEASSKAEQARDAANSAAQECLR